MSQVRDLIIIGSGPAGYTAALYAARANLQPLVFEGSVTAGGALMNTTEVENFPGFPQGIMGPDLMDNMRAQTESFGAELVRQDVESVDFSGDIKIVRDAMGGEFRSRAVILAMGSAYRELGLDDEQRLSGRGVSWCATCDGAFFRNRKIMVIGGGDSALEEATFLTRFASEVVVVHRRDELRASKIMSERALSNEKISFRWNSQVVGINGENAVESVTLQDSISGETSVEETDAVFIAIGHDPRNELIKGVIDCDEQGYVLTSSGSTATNNVGVFAAGDLVDHTYRQAITAAASGCQAALDAERFLA